MFHPSVYVSSVDPDSTLMVYLAEHFDVLSLRITGAGGDLLSNLKAQDLSQFQLLVFELGADDLTCEKLILQVVTQYPSVPKIFKINQEPLKMVGLADLVNQARGLFLPKYLDSDVALRYVRLYLSRAEAKFPQVGNLRNTLDVEMAVHGSPLAEYISRLSPFQGLILGEMLHGKSTIEIAHDSMQSLGVVRWILRTAFIRLEGLHFENLAREAIKMCAFSRQPVVAINRNSGVAGAPPKLDG